MKRRWRLTGAALVVLLVGAVILDRLFPLALPGNDSHYARIVVDSLGRPLRTFADSNGVWRYKVAIEDVSPLYIEALLHYEDRWFWSHPGINPLSIARAAWQNITSGRVVSGGSTLSMQVARLLHPHSRSLSGKLYQLLRTVQLEWHLSKPEILTLYLNLAPFGGTLEGVQAASYSYLSKPALDLTHAEAALLAVLPQAPTRYRPDRAPQAAQQARDKVLDRLAEYQVWTDETVQDAKIEPVAAYGARPEQHAPLLARHLIAKHDGEVVATTIDGDMQAALEDHLANHIARLASGMSAAVMVMETQTGKVRAYLGSAGFADPSRQGYIDMVRAVRSPGSTLKPFLFAMALDEGLIHSHSLLADVPRHWGDYRPGNFDEGFSGPVSASAALQRSLNVPFIDLLERYGPARFTNNLSGAGVKLRIPGNQANLAVILGGAGTTLEQLVGGYAALARGGKAIKPRLTADVPKQEFHLVSEGAAWITWQTLAQISRPGSLNTHALLRSYKPMAWKTGTSFGFRDTWAIGVSSEYTIGVWIGKPDGTPVPGHSGRATAGPLLFSISDHIQRQIAAPQQPGIVSQTTICWPLGIEPTDNEKYCHSRHKAWVLDDIIPPTWHGADADLYQRNPLQYQINADTGLLLTGNCNVKTISHKTLAWWPTVLEPWLPKAFTRHGQLPEQDPACKGLDTTTASKLQITAITPNATYSRAAGADSNPSVPLKAMGGSGKYHWYINGEHQYTTAPSNVIPHPLTKPGTIQILVTDDAGNIDKLSIQVVL